MSMQAPQFNLVVIRSPDIDRAVIFYQLLGVEFKRHAHGDGPEHYSADMNGVVFEIYPQSTGAERTREIRLGFRVNDVDSVVTKVVAAGGKLVAKPKNSPWGRRAVIQDLDGISVELTTTLPVDA